MYGHKVIPLDQECAHTVVAGYLGVHTSRGPAHQDQRINPHLGLLIPQHSHSHVLHELHEADCEGLATGLGLTLRCTTLDLPLERTLILANGGIVVVAGVDNAADVEDNFPPTQPLLGCRAALVTVVHGLLLGRSCGASMDEVPQVSLRSQQSHLMISSFPPILPSASDALTRIFDLPRCEQLGVCFVLQFQVV